VHRSATALSEAASAVAGGHYDIRVPPPRLGKEFDAVAAAFNKMAQQLGVVDETRRQMLADLAHEIRTPVAVLEAYMEALEDGVRQLDQDTIGTLRDQTRRLTRFSVDVNALSAAERRTTSIDSQWISPNALIDTAVAAFAPRYSSKGVDLTSRIDDGLPTLWADYERLGQVLGNLLDNALRHTGPGGRVDVTAAAVDDELLIAISDTGAGVAREHLPRLFDRFYRADAARDRQHGGAGIGLSIAKALVDAHGGQIEAHSDDTDPVPPSPSPCPVAGSLSTACRPRRSLARFGIAPRAAIRPSARPCTQSRHETWRVGRPSRGVPRDAERASLAFQELF
jgi:signal transduction histidine kinase